MSDIIYHISDDGVARRCTAKKKPCQYGADDHFSSKEEAQKNYEARQSMNEALAATTRTESVYTDQAVNSTLPGYHGEEPAWLTDLKGESQKLYGDGVPAPKIIDVIDVEGRPTAVVWSDQSTSDVDTSIILERGYSISGIAYNDLHTGKRIGYVKASWVDDESAKRSFGDDEWSSFRAFDDREGTNTGILKYKKLGPRDYVKHDITTDMVDDESRMAVKTKLWVGGHKALEKYPEGLSWSELRGIQDLTKDHAPTNEAELDAGLEEIRTDTIKRYDNWMKNNRVPHIDYSNLDDEYRRKGIGNSMYVYLARQLGSEKNQVLASSTLQSEHAVKTWKRMAADKRIPVGVITTSYTTTNSYGSESTSKSSRFFIDYRNGEDPSASK